ncbi:MAG: hypothetical protein ACLPY5_09305 [Candidatus Bathyarchaeia archaeon]
MNKGSIAQSVGVFLCVAGFLIAAYSVGLFFAVSATDGALIFAHIFAGFVGLSGVPSFGIGWHLIMRLPTQEK